MVSDEEKKVIDFTIKQKLEEQDRAHKLVIEMRKRGAADEEIAKVKIEMAAVWKGLSKANYVFSIWVEVPGGQSATKTG